MPAILRIVAVAVLALVIPVQGMAAVVAGQCMALGQNGQAGTQDAGDHGCAEGHDGAIQSQGDEDSTSEGHDGKHCGPCAACCASASISAASAPVTLLPQSNTKHVFFGLPPHELKRHSLDRPPLAL